MAQWFDGTTISNQWGIFKTQISGLLSALNSAISSHDSDITNIRKKIKVDNIWTQPRPTSYLAAAYIAKVDISEYSSIGVTFCTDDRILDTRFFNVGDINTFSTGYTLFTPIDFINIIIGEYKGTSTPVSPEVGDVVISNGVVRFYNGSYFKDVLGNNQEVSGFTIGDKVIVFDGNSIEMPYKIMGYNI